MASDAKLRRYRGWYSKLLRLYPKHYYGRFAEGMEQTFADLLRERAARGRALLGPALWMGAETFALIVGEKTTPILVKYKNFLRIALIVAGILLVPLAAMKFTPEVNWSGFDFAVAGTLLLGTGLIFDFLLRRAGTMPYRLAAAIAVGTALLLVWVNLAVGIIGSENNPANLMYAGVLSVAVIGALFARFQSQGMARAMRATALAQAVVGVVAVLFAGQGRTVIADAVFMPLWLAAAALFQRAARQEAVSA